MNRKQGSKNIIICIFVLFLCGCGNSKTVYNMENYTTSIKDISIPDNVKIIGFGEATHGNVEFQQIKKDIFEALLNNNECRIFAIEGDFGGGYRINKYINGGEGTAKDAVAQLGFAIYRTKEMEELIQWMRDYNDKVSVEQRINFYGYDMQRYDNSKQIVFDYLEKVNSTNLERYIQELSELNDDTVYNQKKSKIKKGMGVAKEIQNELEKNKSEYIKITEKSEYAIACECIKAIIENTKLQTSGTNYSKLRDKYMKNRVNWIYQFEGQHLLFINGHNGHIDKSSSVKGYTSMGKMLTDDYGDDYFAIGSDFSRGKVNVVSADGNRRNILIKNRNKLIQLFESENDNISYLDFDKVEENKELMNIISRKQRMVSLGAQFDNYQKFFKLFYTLKMSPSKAYDAIVIVKTVSPTFIE